MFGWFKARTIVVRAFRPGDVVLLEHDHALSREQSFHLYDILARAEVRTGLKFVLLPDRLRVVGREQQNYGRLKGDPKHAHDRN